MRSSRVPFVLLLGLGLLAGLSSFLVSQTQEAGDLLDQNQAGVVAIVIYGADKQEIAKGTGFAIAEDVVATAYHVVSRAVEAEALTFKGKNMKVEGFLAVNKPLDIALVKIKGKVQPLSLGNSDELTAGGRVFAIGSNEAGTISISEGTIRRMMDVPPGQKFVEFSLAVPDQYCGSPLLDVGGKVVGLMLIMERGLKFGVPVNLLDSLPRTGKITPLKSSPPEDYLNTLDGAFLAGRVATIADDLMTARMNLEKAVRLNPGLTEGQMLLAGVYGKQRDYSAAVNAYQKVVELDDQRSEAHYGLASVLLKMHRFGEAIPSLEKAIALNIGVKEAFYDLGTAYEDTQNYAKAAEAYERYLNSKPEGTGAGYLRLGTCRMKLNEFEAAIAAFEEARKAQPKDVKTIVSLAEACVAGGRLDMAEAAYRALIDLNPNEATTYYGWIIRMYDGAGKYDQAIEAAKKIIELNPKSELAVYNLGIMYLKLQRYDEAVGAFRQALALKPDYASAMYNIGYSYSLAKKYKESIQGFEKYTQLAPEDPLGWLNVGIGYMQLKNFEAALEPMRKSVELKPDNASAQFNLAIVYINLKDTYSAREVHKTLQGLDAGLADRLKKYLR